MNQFLLTNDHMSNIAFPTEVLLYSIIQNKYTGYIYMSGVSSSASDSGFF